MLGSCMARFSEETADSIGKALPEGALISQGDGRAVSADADVGRQLDVEWNKQRYAFPPNATRSPNKDAPKCTFSLQRSRPLQLSRPCPHQQRPTPAGRTGPPHRTCT